MLHPSARTLWNTVNGGIAASPCFWIFIAEGDAVVIKSQHHLDTLSQRSHILIALVGTDKSFAREHPIVFLHVADEREISTDKRQFLHLQGLLPFIADDQCLAFHLSRELAIRRCHLSRGEKVKG